MICISIAPESHTFGKADLYNAEPQCDVVEIRLDRLKKTPDVPRLLDGRRKPVLISCRRYEDGGGWIDDEQARRRCLRAAIAAGPEFVELEIDVAGKIPRFGNTKRIVSYTQLQGPLPNLDAVYQRAIDADADMVKFAAPTPTLESAMPLLWALKKQRKVPLIVCGLGRPGLTLSLLSCKVNSPFIYAALEKGMEAYEGQATVTELEEIYRWRDITSKTRLVAVLGFNSTQTRTIRALNAEFARTRVNFRCLPIEIDDLSNMERLFESLRIDAILPDAPLRGRILSVADEVEESAHIAQQADLLLKSKGRWHAYNRTWRSAMKVLENSLGKQSPSERPLTLRNVMLIGATATARAIAYGVQHRKGLISVAAADNERALLLAQIFDARFVPLSNLYNTLYDVVIITDSYSENPDSTLNLGFLRENMTVMDVSRTPEETDVLEEARLRGCKVVEPLDIYVDQLAAQFRAITGKKARMALLRESLLTE